MNRGQSMAALEHSPKHNYIDASHLMIMPQGVDARDVYCYYYCYFYFYCYCYYYTVTKKTRPGLGDEREEEGA